MSRRYEIIVEKDETTGKAIDIKWSMKPIDDTSGFYILRSNLKNTDEKRIFDIFTMLLEVEDSFRSMKSDLGLRPVYHQTDSDATAICLLRPWLITYFNPYA